MIIDNQLGILLVLWKGNKLKFLYLLSNSLSYKVNFVYGVWQWENNGNM